MGDTYRWRFLSVFPEGTSMSPMAVRRVAFIVAVAAAAAINCWTQEVGFVDLTQVAADTDLRRPPSTPNAGAARGWTEKTDRPCSPSSGGPDSLLTTLVSLDRTYYQIGDQPRFEVTLENVGSVPLGLPFSPHLADLQPQNPAQKFTYSELEVVLWIGARKTADKGWWSANTGGAVSLYGADDHAHSMVTLDQGEWVRIIGEGKLTLPPDGPIFELIRSGSVVDHAFAKVSLSQVETLLTATATAKVRHNVCLQQVQGEAVPISLPAPQP
jgi:hypothetical protein